MTSAVTRDAAPDDELLMSQVQGGDVEAFGALCERYVERAYRVAWLICGEQDAAENAVHEAFVSVWDARQSYRAPRATAAASFLGTVRERAVRVADRDSAVGSPRTGGARGHACAVGPQSRRTAAIEEAGALPSSLSALPQTEREVIGLAFYGQLTYTEIATVLNLPAETIKGRMRFGLHKLKGEPG